MQLLNHHKRPCDSFSFGYAIIILVSFVFKTTFAEYDCSAKTDGWYYDSEFCHIYWRCIHGASEEFECASGTAWDHHDNRCNWIDNVDCSRAEKTTAKIESSGEEHEPDGGDDEADEIPAAVVNLLNDKPKRSHSNKKLLDNKDGEDSHHTTTSRKKSDTDTLLSEPTIGVIVAPTHGKDSSGGGVGSSTSAVDCQPTGIYTVADPSECNAYYQCDKGIRTRLNCPERQLFDADKRQCMEYERVFCGTRSVNLADKNQCINKRDGIHPDVERECHFYYQCLSQNKMREAKCPGDQKFNSYTGKCGPANSAPMPCGPYVPGSATVPYQRNIGFFISAGLTIIFFLVFDL